MLAAMTVSPLAGLFISKSLHLFKTSEHGFVCYLQNAYYRSAYLSVQVIFV